MNSSKTALHKEKSPKTIHPTHVTEEKNEDQKTTTLPYVKDTTDWHLGNIITTVYSTRNRNLAT